MTRQYFSIPVCVYPPEDGGEIIAIEFIYHYKDGSKLNYMHYAENKCKKRKSMDKKIKKLQKKTKDLEKDESSLLRMDKKHDKVIDKAKKIVKKKKK